MTVCTEGSKGTWLCIVDIVVVPSLKSVHINGEQRTCEIVGASRDHEVLANVLALTIHIAIKWAVVTVKHKFV